MFNKIHILGAAFFAVLAFSVVAAASASAAEPVWLNLSNVQPPNGTAAETDGHLDLHIKKIPLLSGGGEVTALCDGKFEGTVGEKGQDSVTMVLDLNGKLISEATPLSCEAVGSTNAVCTNGKLILVWPVGLPWKTQLTGELPAEPPVKGVTFDNFEKEGGGSLGYKSKCEGVTVECPVTLDRAEFDENKPEGALFLFLGELVSKCSNGGEGTVLGHGVVLDFFVH